MGASIPCWILRGGTSKGVFLLDKDLPPLGRERDRAIRAIMGTAHSQIDGLGGGHILNSKVAVLGPPTREDAHVDYTFAQVATTMDMVSYEGSCGNISAAVGPFAVESGLVKPKEGMNLLRIHNVNIGKIIRAEFEVRGGEPVSEGAFQIDGAPGTGAPVLLDFAETVGSVTGLLLPLSAPVAVLDGLGVEVSLVDVANPCIFVRARDFGLKGDEEPARIDTNERALARIEAVRGAIAVRLGLARTADEAFRVTPYLPFICCVAPGNGADITARLIGHGQVHRSFPGTGAAALAAAARTEGSIVREMLGPWKGDRLRIGHPSGVLEVEIGGSARDGFDRIAIARTWRKILEGRVFPGGPGAAPEAPSLR
jgi:2-methylaconitate cis-trans-isomerase PrpF